MPVNVAIGDRSSRRVVRLKTMFFALAAIGWAVLMAAWITGSDLSTFASAALSGVSDRATFEDRFLSALRSPGGGAVRPVKPSVLAKGDMKTPTAQEALAHRWISEDFRPSITDDEPHAVEAKPVASAGIPLPRSRPAAADQVVQAGPTLAFAGGASRPTDRSLWQKFQDLMPGRITLASLAPNGGLFHRGPDLASLGYDNLTAVYDISAHAVYLPNGVILEAHSGLGSLRDDPEHISVPNAGSTPPAVYALKPREKEFHGVAALRMLPTDGSDILGRSGLLVHSFMLGPNGDSNGCISIKEYDRFLKAFNDGHINRIAVVTSLKAEMLTAQNPT